MIIIQCPHCQVRFNITSHEDLIGRSVKCHRCGTTWVASSIDLNQSLPDLQDNLPEAPIPEADLPMPPKNRFVWMFVLGLGIALSLGFLIFLKQTPVEQGIKSDLALSLAPLEYRTTEQGAELIIRGKITNQTDQLYRLPALVILMFDEKHTLLESKKRLPPMRLLGPGRDIDLEMNVLNPPVGVYKVEVTFQDEQP